nr:helix-turn-helix transcriptional regulator [Geodermatophilus normandii]
MTAVIAGQLKAIRQDQGMSAQQLADATERLGHPVPRSVIANLENGRRDSIGLPEVLVLARALDVPPVTLLFPLGRQPDVEVLPETTVHPWAAVRWFTGEGGSPAPRNGTGEQEADRRHWRESTVALFREDDQLRDSWLVARGTLLHTPEGSPELADLSRRQLLAITYQWGAHRRRMRAAGMEPEPLLAEHGWPADVLEAVNDGASSGAARGDRG